MNTLGLRHVALNVRDPQVSKRFYMDTLKMELEWEPDSDNVYLTNQGQDNLAIHRSGESSGTSGDFQKLDHIGFALPSADSVDEWYAWIKSQGAKIIREVKTHRDGAKSFYLQDPDGITIQMIYHPPIARQSTK